MKTKNIENKPLDIREKTFSFAVEIVQLCRNLEGDYSVWRVLGKQLLMSGTFIEANAEEAHAGQTRADFISKYAITLKEARETIYWLRLIQDASSLEDVGIHRLIQEAEEISKIIGSIIVNTKKAR